MTDRGRDRAWRTKAPVLALLLCGCGSPAAPEDPGEQPVATYPADLADEVEWLRGHVAPISTVRPGPGDFSDLAAVGAAVGSARVVLLGEQSHGDGTVFLMKARLIQYLHEELGFDVLAFESGLYDLDRAWREVQEGEPVPTAIRSAVFEIWTGSEEFQPTIEYVEERAASDRPLELAGFDLQFTGTASRDHLVQELDSLLRGHDSSLPAGGSWSTFLTQLQEVVDGAWRTSPPSAGERTDFEAVLGQVQSEVDALVSQGAARAALWKEILAGTADEADRLIQYARRGSVTQDQVNRRDHRMGRNLVWLANERFPDRKIIVWAATFHIVRHIEAIDPVTAELDYSGLVTMGEIVGQELGSDAYMLGFTAYFGTYATWWDWEMQLLAPSARSLEGMLNEAGEGNAFLDLRTRPTGGEWLDGPIVARPLGYTEMTASWPTQLDGIIYNRIMARSTPSGG